MELRLGKVEDISGILALQERNLYSNLTTEQRQAGFVTTPFNEQQIKELLNQKGAFVAKDNSIVLGYIFAGDWDFFSQWDIFPFMVARFPTLSFKGQIIQRDRTFQYGSVCIDSSQRGTNLLPQLFEVMRQEFLTKFKTGITFINTANRRSYEAHTRKLKMTIIDRFEFNHNNYYSLAFDTAICVV